MHWYVHWVSWRLSYVSLVSNVIIPNTCTLILLIVVWIVNEMKCKDVSSVDFGG